MELADPIVDDEVAEVELLVGVGDEVQVEEDFGSVGFDFIVFVGEFREL